VQLFFTLQLLHLTSLFIYIHLIIYLITNYPLETKIKIIISILSLSALWSFCKIFLYNPAVSFEISYFFYRLMSIAWILLPTFFILFSLSFSNFFSNLKLNFFKIIIIFIPSVAFIFLNFLGFLTDLITFNSFYMNIFKNNFFAYLFYSYFIIYTIGSIFHFLSLKNKTKIKNKRKQLNLFIITTIITLLILIIVEVILPFILKPHPFFDITNVYFLFFAFGIIYALLKYQFLGFSPAKTFDTIIYNISEFLFILDEEFNFIFINNSALKILKYNINELINKPFGWVVNPYHNFNKLIKDLITKKTVAGYDLSLKTKDNRIIPVSFSAKVVEEKGNIIKIICIAIDITEKVKLIENLNEQRELAQKYLNIAPVIFLILNNKWEIIFLNENGMKILGIFSENEYIGKNWFDEFIFEDEKDSLKSYFLKFINEKTVIEDFENFVITKSNEKKLIHWSNILLKDKENKIYGILSAGIDITEKEKTEEAIKENYEKLKELNRLKDNFISIVSHELRTPLTSIMGFISLMRGGAAGKLNKDQMEYLEIMKGNADRLLALINDLLDISKIESGKLQISPSKNDLIYLISSTITEVKSLMDKKQITCELNFEKDNLLINVDKLRIKQAIANLLSNAIKFSPVNSKITVEFKTVDKNFNFIPSYIKEKINSDNKFVLISITDTGIGMTEDQIQNLFQKFYQAEDANKRKSQGTGLGLYISKSLVELHNGFIWAESNGLNKGSTFNILLPL